MNNVTVFPIM